MKRTLTPLHLKNAPLILVLSQINISPVLEMESFIPKIQEKLRHVGYPLFKRAETQEVVFGPQIKINNSTRWIFIDKTSSTAVVITSHFIAFETNVYTTFDDFAKKLQGVLEIVGEIVKISLVKKIGLRYIDLIQPKEGESFKEYFKPGLLGLDTSCLNVKNTLLRLECSSDTEIGKLVVRLFQREGKKFLPPDLDAPILKFNLPTSEGKYSAILDTDNFSTVQTDYAPSNLLAVMWNLHDLTDTAFRSSVTPEALKRWE